MSSPRRIVIEFLGSDKSLSSTAAGAERNVSTLSGKMKKFGAVAAVGFAAAGVAAVKFGGDAIGSASDLNETVSKSRAIFGQQAVAMEKWAGGAAKSAGLSKQAALDAAAGFGDMFSQIGFAGKEAAKMSKSTVQMAADLGSFNNLPTADVADRLSAAFRGEYDSLQSLIPNINGARVEQEAMAASGKKNAKELTAQEKAAAVLAIVNKDGARAQGDFARTSDGLANQQKILTAQFENVKATVGNALLPVVLKLSTWFMNDGIPALQAFSGQVRSTLGPVIEWVRGLFTSSTNSMSGDVSRNLGAIRSTFESVVSIIQSLWNTFGATLMAYTKTAFDSVRTIIGGALQVISGVFKLFSSILKGDWKGAWDAIKTILSGAWTVLKGLVTGGWNTIKAAFRLGGTAVKGIFEGLWTGIKSLASSGVSAVVTAVKGIPGKLRDLGGVFKSAGKHLIDAFVDGMKNAAGIVSGIAGKVWDSVKRLLNNAIDRINSSLEFKIDTPGPGGVSINPPNIPHLAKGGVVQARRGGTLALLGEAGHDEAVIPLSGPHAPRAAAAAGSGPMPPLQVVVQMDGRTVAQALLRYERETGELVLAR